MTARQKNDLQKVNIQRSSAFPLYQIIERKVKKMTIYSDTFHGKKRYMFRCYYTDASGKRKQRNSKFYGTKKEAKEAQAAFMTIERVPITTIRFEDAAYAWCEFTRNHNTEKTYKRKVTIIDTFLKPLHGKRLVDITAADIKSVLYSEDFLKYSTSTKNTVYSYLNAIFKYSMVYYGLQFNPVAQIPRFRKTDEERMHEMNIYTPEQFDTFYRLFSKSHKEMADLLFLIFWTGMRLNEALSLTFDCFDGHSLHIRRQYVKGQWKALKTKGSRRTIALDPDCIKIISEQYKKYSVMPKFSENWFIFGGYVPIADNTLTRQKNKCLKENNLPYITIHELRHSHASFLIDQGVSLYKISKRLGHSSYSITADRYGHLIDRQEDEVLTAIRHKKM